MDRSSYISWGNVVMLVQLFRFFQGCIKIKISGNSLERFLNLCRNKRIVMWKLEVMEDAYSMYVHASDFKLMKPCAKKTKTKIRILERKGIPFFLFQYRKRKLFFFGILVCCFLIYCSTFFVWDITFVGNSSITDEVLEEYLHSQSVYEGMQKKRLDCMQIAKDLRIAFENITWVSASIDGTKLKIEIKEKLQTAEDTAEEEPCDIIAKESGQIVSIVTRNGTPLVRVGDMVEKGDVLVSGSIDIQNDARETVSRNYVRADADIILERTMEYQNECTQPYKKKIYTGKKRFCVFLKIRDVRIQFGLERNSFEEKTYSEECHDLFRGIQYGCMVLEEYKWETKERTETEMETILQEEFENYCKELLESGTEIIESNYSISDLQESKIGNGTLKIREDTATSLKKIDLSGRNVLESNELADDRKKDEQNGNS